jgi:predicted small lipoprotein YifL
MKNFFAMMVIFGVAAAFMAGCGKKEEPATSLGNLKKATENAATDASKTADKAAADVKKAAADLKK